MSTIVRLISYKELPSEVPALVELLRDTVDGSVMGGASMGFLPPLTRDEATHYWLSLLPEIHAGARLLFTAYTDDRLVGSCQLKFAPWPNARHRAEIQKLFVDTSLRGRGVGRALMIALHAVARQRGRSLLLLNTRHGSPAERFYKELGYKEVGVIPGYATGPTGERYDDVALYQELSS